MSNLLSDRICFPAKICLCLSTTPKQCVYPDANHFTVILENYDSHFLKQIELPHLYKEIVLHMWELKQLYGYNQDCVIFNNKEILIKVKTLYDNKWHQHGVLSIQDLLNNKGKFLSCQQSSRCNPNYTI